LEHTRSDAPPHVWLMNSPSGHAPEHGTHTPGLPAPQPNTYWPAGHPARSHERQMRFRVAVHGVTSNSSSAHGVQPAAAMMVYAQLSEMYT